jgi:type I restriction enzyme S subunit
MELKPGYKLTEAGVIPEDWEVATLSSLSKESMQNGVFYKPALKGTGVKLINVADLYARTPIDPDALELFNATEEECERFKVEDGDLFFTRSSVVPSGIAYCNVYSARDPGPVVFDSHVIRVRPDTRRVVPLYLFRFCVAPTARRFLVAHSKTATMTTIDQRALGKCPVILPPVVEQEAIAETLGDADALIRSLEQLITKKRHLKQGAMQELLTGRSRLPGFELSRGYKQTEVGVIPQDWGVVRACDACSRIQDGTHFSPRAGGNDYFYVTSRNIRFGYLDISTANRIDRAQHEAIYRRCDVQKGDVLLTKDGANTGNAALNTLDDEFSLLSSVAFLRFHDSKYSAAYFLQQVLTSRGQRQIKDAMAGNAITRLTLAKINNLTFPAPPTKTEQVAIATILSDMDTEIIALEGELTKSRQLKQGMMQELLTGRTRLV